MLALRHFGICGFLRIFAGVLRIFAGVLRTFAGVLRKFVGVLRVISSVFGGSFHFAHLNPQPQTLKNTLDIQLPFQNEKQGIVRVSGV